MTFKVLCIGQSVLDIQVKGIDFQESSKENRMAERVQLSVGGDATNQSIVLSKLGINSTLISGVGEDSVGLFIKNYIQTTDVNVNNVRVIKNSTSPIIIVVIDKEGERSFIFANLDFRNRDLFLPDSEIFQDYDVVSLGSMFGSPIHSRKNIETVLRAAKDAGAIVCADIIGAPNTDRLHEVSDLFSNIDFIFPNEDEARAFTGKENIDEIADHLLEYGIKHVILKQGKNGCFLKTDQERFSVPAYRVEAVDTTGAGDNFVAGFISALLDGKSLQDCCKFGCATAAVSIQAMGGNSGVENKEQVMTFIEEYSGNHPLK